MSHHHSSLNFIPQTRPPLPTNFATPIKPSNDDDDVFFLCSVPKVPHTPDDYDPECKCSTCQLITKLLAECTCKECRGEQTNQVNQTEGKVVHSSKNVTIANQVSPPIAQPSEVSIQTNDASTSERMNGNAQNDERESRSSTPDYLPRIFDDESRDSSSDDSEDEDSVDVEDKELSQENESDDNSNDSKYAFSRPSESLNELTANSGNAGQFVKYIKTIKIKKSHKCPSCNQRFMTTTKLKSHYREKHQQLKRKGSVKTNGTDCPHCGRNVLTHQLKRHVISHKNPGYRCAWSNCGFFYSQLAEAKKHICSDHLQVETANSQQTNQYLVKVDPSTGNTGKVNHYQRSTSSIAFNSNCPKCGRNFQNGGLFTQHVRTHTKSGFRCTWRQCGFFFSDHGLAKQHILKEHFKGELVNAKQLNEHLVKVHAKPVKQSVYTKQIVHVN